MIARPNIFSQKYTKRDDDVLVLSTELCKMAEVRLVQMPVSEHGRKEGVIKYGAPVMLSGMPYKLLTLIDAGGVVWEDVSSNNLDEALHNAEEFLSAYS